MQQEDMQTPTQLLAEADDRFKVMFQTFPRKVFPRRFPFTEDLPRGFFPEKFLQKISDLDSTAKNDKRMTLPDFQSDDC